MNNKYKKQDIILKAEFTMITSKLFDDVIMIYIYNNDGDTKERWVLNDGFEINRRDFNTFSDRVSFLLGDYIRKTCDA